MTQVKGVIPVEETTSVARLHPSLKPHAEKLEAVLLRSEVEFIAMSPHREAPILIARYRSRILRSSDLTPGERAMALTALMRLARHRPLAPPLESILPTWLFEALQRGSGIDLIPLLKQAGDYIKNLKLHPLVQMRSIEGTRALADSPAMA